MYRGGGGTWGDPSSFNVREGDLINVQTLTAQEGNTPPLYMIKIGVIV